MQKKDEFMELSTPEGAPLERRIRITVPAAEVESRVAERLRHRARQARLPGFRPGRIPPAIVERHFGHEALMDALDSLINDRYGEVLRGQDLRPVGQPQVDVEQGGRGQDLIFTAVVEVYPDFEPVIPEGPLTRRVAEITEEDIDRTLGIMQAQRRTFAAVERPAQEGDQVRLDFTGTLDGEAFPGGTVDDHSVLLGAGRLLPDMENALTGLSAGEEKDVDVHFPDDYPSAELAGRTARFRIRIREVAEPVLPEVDAAFARSLGIGDGDVAVLRQEVRENLEREARRISRIQVKADLLDLMAECNRPELPRQLVAQEEARAAAGQENAAPEAGQKALAERRVRLGLVLTEIVRREQLRSSPALLEAALLEMAGQYEDPREFAAWYRKDAQRMEELGAMVLEDQVVDWLLGRVTVTEEPVGFQQLMGHAPAAAAENSGENAG